MAIGRLLSGMLSSGTMRSLRGAVKNKKAPGLSIKAVVKVKDNGADQALRNLAGTRSVEVGIFSGIPHPSGMSAAELALIHEFGIGVPQRSFVRAWVDSEGDKHAREFFDAVLANVRSSTDSLDRPLMLGGEAMKKRMIDNINRRIPPPNAPSTLARKQGDIPLIDSGEMVGAISVRKGQGK